MVEIHAILASSFRVKIVTYVHFILISNALIGTYLPIAYLYYNSLFLVTLFWTMHSKDSVDPIQIACLINACSIIFDLICIITYYSAYYNSWSIVFSIINLITRPFSLLLMHRELCDRGGNNLATMFGVTSVHPSSGTQRNYEDIDRPVQSIPTNLPISETSGIHHNKHPNISNIF